ncbi:golgin subfamily A member 6-like protein 2 [Haliaeetus albicilla]|uniref:golgin subfamily A member 6-like protein 2 n=1 Tax=Haliaeetus albicilla TaxID=8969 RepID=UPI0037E7CA93
MASGAAQALLHVVWGILSPPGAGRWYFLLAFRLLAVAFARGVWRGPPHDLLCVWDSPGHAPPPPAPGLRRLCAALCYDRHFPAPMAALWNLSFLLALLPITLLRLLHPPARPPRGDEGGGDSNMAAGRAVVAAGCAVVAAGHGNVAAGHENMAAGHANMAAGHENMAEGHENMAARCANMAAGHENMATGHENMAARCANMAAGHENMATGHENMAARCANMATRCANMAAGWDREGGGEGSGSEDEMAAGCGYKMAAWCGGHANMAAGHTNMAAGRANMAAGHTNMAAGRANMAAGRANMAGRSGGGDKMAAGRRGSVRSKMAARPRPADESSALIWMDESDASAWPRPVGTSKMAARRHPAHESEAGWRTGQSDAAAARRPPARSDMAAGRGLPARSDMAARRRPTPVANMAAASAPPSPGLPALPPALGGHDGRGRWRVWLGAGAAAMLAAGEGGFLWAVLWRQLPAVTAAPIGCRPGHAPCPPLACALPAPADKMAALLGVAASAAVSLVAVAAAAVMAAARAWRGRGRGRAGPV